MFAAVSQPYTTEPHNEYVVLYNDALLRCSVPSFVADFVTVAGWVDSMANSYTPGDNSGRRTHLSCVLPDNLPNNWIHS